MTEPEFQVAADPGHCEHCSAPTSAIVTAAAAESAYSQAREVLRALRELDPIGRIALHLIYCHDRSQAQVADELRIPHPVVGSAVARGMRVIAARLAAGSGADEVAGDDEVVEVVVGPRIEIARTCDQPQQRQ